MKSLIRLFAILLLAIPAFAQSGSISGKITNVADGALVPGVSVTIVKLKISTETNDVGEYSFEGVPAGTYTLVTHLEGFADKAQRVTVSDGAQTVDFALSLAAISAEVTITATGEEQSVYETFSTVSSVGISGINQQASTSLGEVLDNEAGVSKRSFGGGGSSRPSIRSFEGDRVLILTDGVRNGSIGSASGDHGEPISPFNLERIEVIKGPATLLYGSNAIGGVVNTVSDDENEAHPGLRGYFTGFTGSVNKQLGGAGGVEYGIGKYIFKADGNSANEGDIKTPFGRIDNSASRSYGGSFGVGYFGEKSFVRGNFTVDRRRYGIPYAALFESGEILSIANGGIDCEAPEAMCQYDIEAIKTAFQNVLPSVPDENVDIKMRRNNYRVRFGFHDFDGIFDRGNFSIDFTDYNHKEIEVAGATEDVATTFDNDVFSFRGMLSQKKSGVFSGQLGAEGFRRSYLTQGAEQLIDGRVRQDMFGIFGLQQIEFKRVALQLGARLESNRYNPVNPVYTDLNFAGISAAAGIRFEAWKGGSIVASFASSYRAPGMEELYNFGPHIGTVTFEIGNELLERERSNGIEFSVRHQTEKVRVNASFFLDSISNFIYLAPLDEDGDGQIDVDDNLPVAFYNQENARFYGFDGSIEADFNKNLGAFFVGDIVRAKITSSDTPLPRISPARGRFGISYRSGGFSLRPEIAITAKKGPGDIFPLETTTDGYTLFNVNGAYAFNSKGASHIFTFGVLNIGDKVYRTHTNFIKDLTPEAGRGVKFSYTVRFF
ncbi:MAG: TonB-dependent receptor [Pyrinomonadaceae bacterium]